MEDKKDILKNLKKLEKPSVPSSFFETFSDDLMAKISENESGLNILQKTVKPELSESFLDGFAKGISEKVTSNETQLEERAVPVLRLKLVGFVSAIAACLSVMYLVIPAENNQTAQIEIENETLAVDEAISDDDLLAYIDADDMIEYILEEKIEIGSTTQNLEIIKNSPTETSSDLEELDEEDILYYLEEDFDELYLEDIEL
jgi:hypothetical protein